MKKSFSWEIKKSTCNKFPFNLTRGLLVFVHKFEIKFKKNIKSITVISEKVDKRA